MIELKSATNEELKSRIELLEDEVEANEQENRFNRAELEKLYAEQDARVTK